MAEWRARGYVEDSDEEEDSQNSISIDLTPPREAGDIHDTGAIDFGKPHHVEAHDGQDERGGLEAEQNGTGTMDTRKESSSTATLFAQREKENVLSPAAGYNRHDTRDLIGDAYEDIDELQQDHYSATAAAQAETKILSGAHGLEARPRLSEVPSSPISLPSSLSSTPILEVSKDNHGLSSTPGMQRSAHEDQKDELERSIDGSLKSLWSNSQRNTTYEPEHPALNQAQGFQRATRNLRHRNPIQLHPYAVESEHYRRTLKARGVKPLRIAQMEAEAAQAREQDTQNIEFAGEEYQPLDSDTERPAPYSSSPIHPQSSPVASNQDRGDIFVFGDDDDLPDMDTLLSHSTIKYVGNGHKRRKTAKTRSTAFRMPQGLDVGQNKPIPGF